MGEPYDGLYEAKVLSELPPAPQMLDKSTVPLFSHHNVTSSSQVRSIYILYCYFHCSIYNSKLDHFLSDGDILLSSTTQKRQTQWVSHVQAPVINKSKTNFFYC